MALALVADLKGIETAREIARSLEYIWHEDAGSDPFSKFTNRQSRSNEDTYELVKSGPQANSLVAVAPRYLRLYFSNTPDIAKSSVRLLADNGGQEIEIDLSGMHTMGNSDLMLSIDSNLAAGKYQVAWNVSFRSSSATSQGAYEFRVKK